MGTLRIARSLLLSLIVVLACSSQRTDGLKILGLFPLQGKSHFVMCEKLMKGLAAKGHQVDVYSHFPLKKPIPNFTDHSLAGTLPAVLNNMTYNMFKEFEEVNFELLMKMTGTDVCELMGTPQFQELFKKLQKNQPYDLVVIEIFMANCYIAWGRYLNIPIVGVQTSALHDWFNSPLGNPFNTAVNPSVWSTFKEPMDFWERLSNTFVSNVVSTTFNYYVKDQNAMVEKYFGAGYPDVVDMPRELDLLLVNSHPSLDGVRAYTPAIVPVAGIHIEDTGDKLPKDVQKFLDESKDGCVYISFGSMVRIETFPKHVLDAFYRTFKKIAPVRVLMKIAKPEELPKGLPSNVMTQSWFDQLQVLKHKNLKAFVTHGGLMSTQETLSAGVPVIGVPLFGDQHVNVKSQVRRGTAVMVELNNFNADTLTAAIKKILSDPIYTKNAEHYAKLFFDRPMKSVDTAIFWVEYVARHGKQSLKAPVVDMPWWQVHLVDVYGFVLLVIGVVLYALAFVVKKVVGLIRSSPSNDGKKKKKKNKKE